MLTPFFCMNCPLNMHISHIGIDYCVLLLVPSLSPRTYESRMSSVRLRSLPHSQNRYRSSTLCSCLMTSEFELVLLAECPTRSSIRTFPPPAWIDIRNWKNAACLRSMIFILCRLISTSKLIFSIVIQIITINSK